jgi:hypothetical protein
MILPLALLLQAASGNPVVYSGLARQLDVKIPRSEASVSIDGRLDEAVWRQAAVLTGFSQLQPVDGRPAEDTTQVLVWYGPTAIYFGIRAFESHGAVVATLADRDNIDANDYVQILLDTFNDHRRALVLGVNPFGIQADGIRSEGPPAGASGQQAGGNFANVDLNPDFQYESRGHVTDYGYEIEVRVPFKSIRYQAARQQDWAIQVQRKVTHSGYQNTWTPAVRASASFLSQSGTLAGLTDLQRGLVLDLNPFATTKAIGAPGATGWGYDVTPEIGMNARWGLTTNLTLDGTINPDFSQVEADVAQVTVNQRFALFFPEKRPFFLEGIEQFDTPNGLIYTRQIVDPQGGVKLTGKEGSTNVAFLAAVDDASTSATGSHPIFAITRLRTDLGGNSSTGLVYTGRFDGSTFNQVASGDVHLVFAKLFYFQAQAAASATRAPDASGVASTTWAPMWDVVLDCTARSWGCHYKITGFGRGFQTRSGFVPRTGVVNPFIANRLTYYGAPGATLENYTMFMNLQGIWDYDEFFQGKHGREFYANMSNFFTLRGGWSVALTPNVQSIAFDPAPYAGYGVLVNGIAGFDTVPFTVPGRVTAPSASIQGTTPNFQSFSASGGFAIGKAVAFAEPSRANAFSLFASVTWRPTGQLRVGSSYNRQILNRERDGSRLATADIPRLNVEYQISRPIFVRFIGQYSAQTQDSLRDPRTDLPLFVRDTSGAYRRAGKQTTNDFRVDWLFSYHPNPGTVLYAGYGSSLSETEAFTFRDMRRDRDGFFFKLSYLFRM